MRCPDTIGCSLSHGRIVGGSSRRFGRRAIRDRIYSRANSTAAASIGRQRNRVAQFATHDYAAGRIDIDAAFYRHGEYSADDIPAHART